MTREVKCAAKIPDDKPDAVRAVCDGCREPEENHDGQAERGAAPSDAIDKAYDGA